MAYIADALGLRAGSIIKLESPLSSTGKPTYPHFFVVVWIPVMAKPGDAIRLVGVSSGIPPDSVDPARHVAMKWLGRRGGDPETGFTRPCHTCVDFSQRITVYAGTTYPAEVAAEHLGRFVRAEKFQTIVATLNAWIRRERQSTDGPMPPMR